MYHTLIKVTSQCHQYIKRLTKQEIHFIINDSTKHFVHILVIILVTITINTECTAYFILYNPTVDIITTHAHYLCLDTSSLLCMY